MLVSLPLGNDTTQLPPTSWQPVSPVVPLVPVVPEVPVVVPLVPIVPVVPAEVLPEPSAEHETGLLLASQHCPIEVQVWATSAAV